MKSKNYLNKYKEFGIAIFPNRDDNHKIKKYMKQAKTYGFSRVFTNLIGLSKAELNNFITICKYGQAIGLKMIIDIDETVLKMLNKTISNTKYFHSIGAYGLRMDGKFSAKEIAKLSLTSELSFEINASDFSGLNVEIINYDFKASNLVASHNFFPQIYTGLSLKKFAQANQLYQDIGIKISVFVTINNQGCIAAWKEAQGTPTLEINRSMNVIDQFQYMGLREDVDFIIVSDMYLNCNQMQLINSLEQDKLCFSMHHQAKMSKGEHAIISWDGHKIRGDNAEAYFLRSTISRKQFANYDIAKLPYDHNIIPRGAVVILNNHAGRYKGELHIMKQDISYSLEKNVVGSIAPHQLNLLTIDKPGLKFGFWK